MTGDLERWVEAVKANPREPGEELSAWALRVGAAARPKADRQLPPGDRDDERVPGEEG